jgi:hypothetical protein
MVERALNRLSDLIQLGLSDDVGGLVALSVVLEVVQPGPTVEEVLGRVEARLRLVEAVCGRLGRGVNLPPVSSYPFLSFWCGEGLEKGEGFMANGGISSPHRRRRSLSTFIPRGMGRLGNRISMATRRRGALMSRIG